MMHLSGSYKPVIFLACCLSVFATSKAHSAERPDCSGRVSSAEMLPIAE